MKRWVGAGLVFMVMLSFSTSAYCWSLGKKKAAAPPAQTAPAPVQQEAAPVITPAPAASAAEEPKAVEPAVAEAPQQEVVVEEVPMAQAKPESEESRKLRDKKKKDLNNTVWDVEVMPLSGKGEKGKDSLVFKENKFSSDKFSAAGFAPTNFTLSLQDDKLPVVETMQQSEKEGIVFWRLEFDQGMTTCKGILSRQLPENKTEDYSFISTAKRPYLAQAESKAAATPVRPPASSEQPKV